MMNIPHQFLIIIAVMLVGAWLLLSEKSPGDKLAIIVALTAIFIIYRLIGGATIQDIFSPLLKM